MEAATCRLLRGRRHRAAGASASGVDDGRSARRHDERSCRQTRRRHRDRRWKPEHERRTVGCVKARTIARTIVKALGPDDLAAVVFTEHAKTAQNFTSDRRLLLAAIDTAALFPAPSSLILRIRSKSSRKLPVRRVLDRDARACGRGSRIAPAGTQDDLLHQPRRADQHDDVPVRAASGPVRDVPERLRNAEARCPDGHLPSRTARQCHDLRGGSERTGRKSYPEFLRAIAENTGGRAVVNDNDPELQVGRLLVESSADHLLGFEPAPHKADGRFHRIQVKVAGRDAQVRARSGYFAENAKERKTPRTETASLDDAIGGLVAKSEVPLQVSVAPFADGRGKGALAIALSVTEPASPCGAHRGGHRRIEAGHRRRRPRHGPRLPGPNVRIPAPHAPARIEPRVRTRPPLRDPSAAARFSRPLRSAARRADGRRSHRQRLRVCRRA